MALMTFVNLLDDDVLISVVGYHNEECKDIYKGLAIDFHCCSSMCFACVSRISFDAFRLIIEVRY